MKRWRIIGFLLLLLIIAGGAGLWWKQGGPRRTSIQTLHRLDQALQTSDASGLIDIVSLPAATRDRTAAEQFELLSKALCDEISSEGLAVLLRDGAFGPLTNLFPVEASAWAGQAGVNPGDCVAFKLERNGLRTEAVLARAPDFLRLDRWKSDATLAHPMGEGLGVSTSDEVSKLSAPAFRIVQCNS